MIPRNPSAEFVRLNPHLFGAMSPKTDSGTSTPTDSTTCEKPRNMASPALNKTEQRWQDEHTGDIPQPMRLRWGKCMHYKPDFFCDDRDGSSGMPKLIEVKGGHIRDRDIVRFKGCAAEWGWLFRFEMWQWKERKWTRLY